MTIPKVEAELHFIYFKESGKYYADAKATWMVEGLKSGDSKKPYMQDIVDRVKSSRRDCTPLPGLIGTWDDAVVVLCEEGHPVLIPPESYAPVKGELPWEPKLGDIIECVDVGDYKWGRPDGHDAQRDSVILPKLKLGGYYKVDSVTFNSGSLEHWVYIKPANESTPPVGIGAVIARRFKLQWRPSDQGSSDEAVSDEAGLAEVQQVLKDASITGPQAVLIPPGVREAVQRMYDYTRGTKDLTHYPFYLSDQCLIATWFVNTCPPPECPSKGPDVDSYKVIQVKDVQVGDLIKLMPPLTGWSESRVVASVSQSEYHKSMLKLTFTGVSKPYNLSRFSEVELHGHIRREA
jgi:hypothetical protein